LVTHFNRSGEGRLHIVPSGQGFPEQQPAWPLAEQVVLSIATDDLCLSALTFPGRHAGEEDHWKTVTTFGRSVCWKETPRSVGSHRRSTPVCHAEKDLIRSWPDRPLKPADDRLVRQARCGIEVKSSLWHFETKAERGSSLDHAQGNRQDNELRDRIVDRADGIARPCLPGFL
jgi:hypothetical protein